MSAMVNLDQIRLTSPPPSSHLAAFRGSTNAAKADPLSTGPLPAIVGLKRVDAVRWVKENALARPRHALDRRPPNRQPVAIQRHEETAVMSKPVKTEAELIAMARAEVKVHVPESPEEGIVISVLRAGDSWEFRTSADEATIAKPGYPESVAMIVQIGDHLSKQYDVKG
jgi:hypothetical protein